MLGKLSRVILVSLWVLLLSVWGVDVAVWRYDHIGAIPIRTNRWTGRMQFCSLQGWHDQLPEPTGGLTFQESK